MIKNEDIMKKYLFSFIIVVLILGCDEYLSPKVDVVVYANSFEKESDFTNWVGIGKESWRSDTPNNDSKKSIFISGGCLVPHSYYEFKNYLPQGYYTIECWGKALGKSGGGGVLLTYQGSEKHKIDEVYLSFTDTVWTYKISDTLYFNKSSNLIIEMNAGGIVQSAMLIDEIIVKKVK